MLGSSSDENYQTAALYLTGKQNQEHYKDATIFFTVFAQFPLSKKKSKPTN